MTWILDQHSLESRDLAAEGAPKVGAGGASAQMGSADMLVSTMCRDPEVGAGFAIGFANTAHERASAQPPPGCTSR
jgi:hypothetical protein